MPTSFVDRFKTMLRGQEQTGVAVPDVAAVAVPAEPTAAGVVEAISDPVLCLDGRRRVSTANAAARRLLGEHIEGEDIRVVLRHPAAMTAIVDSAAGSIEITGLNRSDDVWELNVAPLEDGQLIRLIDRSAARAIERSRTDFVANASHELRTPLATLLGFVETLEGPAGTDEAVRDRFLGIMREEAERMTRLVDDLMSLSRIEADKHRAPAEAVDLRALINEVIGIVADRAIDKLPVILVDEAEGGVAPVAGERAQLRQLLHNLVGNALKYGRPGTPVRIELGPRGPATVRLAVVDQGEGIAAEHLPRLTQRFYRVDAGRSRSLGGTGLGLAIVKHIVERHRGTLNILSEVGVGTTVEVLLPAQTASVAGVIKASSGRNIGDASNA